MITPNQISQFFHEYAKSIIGVLAGLTFVFAGWAIRSWADQNYVKHGGLASAVASRDYKDAGQALDDIELEIQRTKVWLTFLDPSQDAKLIQIYTAQMNLLTDRKEKLTRLREETKMAVEATVGNQ